LNREATPRDVAAWLQDCSEGVFSAFTAYRDYYNADDAELVDRLVNLRSRDVDGRLLAQAFAKRWRLTLSLAIQVVNAGGTKTILRLELPRLQVRALWPGLEVDPWVMRSGAAVYRITNRTTLMPGS